MMAEIISSEQKPVPGVDYSEIRIPDEENLGTGTFTILLEHDAMSKINPIVSAIINEPVFQLLVNIDSEVKEVTALVGKADNTPPISREVFILPENIKLPDAHKFEITFKDWEIKDVMMNGDNLERVSV
jgi:hypothetical protein